MGRPRYSTLPGHELRYGLWQYPATLRAGRGRSLTIESFMAFSKRSFSYTSYRVRRLSSCLTAALLLAGFAGLISLAGCGQTDDNASVDSNDTPRVATQIGYMPILPDAQLFVNLENGRLDKAGVEADLVSFQNGPAMVQALASGQLDIAYFGIGPTMVARGKGADIRVVAANIVEQISFVALAPLAGYFENGPADTAFARFAKAEGRKAKISTFPIGSVPQTVFDYWRVNTLGIDASALQMVYQGASQVQQSLLTGAVDGAAILEPVVSIVQSRSDAARVIASGGELFENQPGAVMAVRAAYLNAHPDVVKRLVAAQIDATKALNAGDDDAVSAVAKHVGGGRLPREIIQTAVAHSKDHFVADPHRIVDATKRMYNFQREQGTLNGDLDIDALFDTSFFDAVEGSDGPGHGEPALAN